MNKGCGDVDPVGDAIAWAEIVRKQSEDKIKQEIESTKQTVLVQFQQLFTRVEKLEKK